MCVQHFKLFVVIQTLEQTYPLPLATQHSLNCDTMSENAHTFIFFLSPFVSKTEVICHLTTPGLDWGHLVHVILSLPFYASPISPTFILCVLHNHINYNINMKYVKQMVLMMKACQSS